MIYYLTLNKTNFNIKYINENIFPCKRVKFDNKFKIRVNCKNIDMLKEYFSGHIIEIMTLDEHMRDTYKMKNARQNPRYKTMQQVKIFLKKNPKVRRILLMAIYNNKYQDKIIKELPMYCKEFRDQAFFQIAFETVEKGVS